MTNGQILTGIAKLCSDPVTMLCQRQRKLCLRMLSQLHMTSSRHLRLDKSLWNRESKELDKGSWTTILPMFQKACSIFDHCGEPEPWYPHIWDLYGLYLKHELQMGKNAVFSPYQWVLATVVPWHNWKKEKKKASLHCHLFYFPSFFLYVPVCRSVFAKLFLKLTTTTEPCQWLICPNRISIPLQASLMPWHIQDRPLCISTEP